MRNEAKFIHVKETEPLLGILQTFKSRQENEYTQRNLERLKLESKKSSLLDSLGYLHIKILVVLIKFSKFSFLRRKESYSIIIQVSALERCVECRLGIFFFT